MEGNPLLLVTATPQTGLFKHPDLSPALGFDAKNNAELLVAHGNPEPFVV
jgi:hypothetical protein